MMTSVFALALGVHPTVGDVGDGLGEELPPHEMAAAMAVAVTAPAIRSLTLRMRFVSLFLTGRYDSSRYLPR
jgi:hypothetical protein